MKNLFNKIRDWFRLREPEKYKPSMTPTDITPFNAAPKWLLKIALKYTGSFEGCGYGQITGNFDKQGMSWGVLQWCIGQGSLQEKILRPFMEKHKSDYIHLLHMEELCNLSTKKAVKLAASLFKNPKYRQYAKAFMETPEAVELQLQAADELGSKAWKLANIYFGENSNWVAYSFPWFFDILVQNGSLKGVGRPTKAVMEKYNHQVQGWAPEVKYGLQHILVTWSYLRARKSNKKYFGDVMSRKCTLGLGQGTVHGHRYFGIHMEIINELVEQGGFE